MMGGQLIVQWPGLVLKSGSRAPALQMGLEEVPEELVVDLVVVLDFGGFDEGAEGAGTAVGGGMFQIGIAGFDVGAEKLGGPIGFLEVLDGRVDVVGEISLGLAKVFDF